MNGHTFYLD